MGTNEVQESREQEADALRTRIEAPSEARGVAGPGRTPLLSLRRAEWTPGRQAELLCAAHETQTRAAQVSATYERLAEIVGLPARVALTAAERAAAAELTPVLMECAGTTWAFTTVIESGQIVQDLRVAAALVREYRVVSGQIREPWSAGVTAACRDGLALLREREALRAGLPEPWPTAIVAELERGCGLLRHIAEQAPRLSVQYDLTQLNAAALESGQQRAEQWFWPVSALWKRRIRKALAAAVTGGGEPNPVADLPILTDLESTRAEIAALELRALPAGVWSGLATSVDAAQAALRLQPALAAVLNGSREIPEDLELVASGACGPELKQALDSMRRLAVIDAELDGFAWLTDATDGLWAGMSTDIDALSAAVEFCDEWRAGEVSGDHDAVARGECGEFLRAQLDLLRQQSWMARRIPEFRHLGAVTDGLWRGLDTDVREVRRAVDFGVVLESALAVLAGTPDEAARARSGVGRICRGGAGSDAIRQSGSAFLAACSDLAASLDRMTRSGCVPPEDKARLESMAPRELREECEAMIAAVEKWNFAPPESATS